MNEWPAISIGRDQHSGWSNYCWRNKREKCILDTYEEHFGQVFDHSIVSKKKGKIELDPNLDFPCIKPALEKWSQVSELSILNVIMAVVKEHHLSSYNMKNLQLINKSFLRMIPKVSRWLRINFSPLLELLEPCYIYKQQEHIDTSRVKMASTGMIHFGLNPGKFDTSWEESTLDTATTSIGHCQR